MDTELSPVQQFEQQFPTAGRYSGEQTVAAAQITEASVRYLNHATFEPTSTPWPSTIGDVTGCVHSTVAGLDQLLGQLAARLQWQVERDGRIYTDEFAQGATVDEVNRQYAASVRAARSALSSAAYALNDAHNAASRLGVRVPAERPDDDIPDVDPETGYVNVEGMSEAAGPWETQQPDQEPGLRPLGSLGPGPLPPFPSTGG
jgi:hypothetical protein